MNKVINGLFAAVMLVAVGQKVYAASDEEYFARSGSPAYAQENVNKLNELMAQENVGQQPSQQSGRRWRTWRAGSPDRRNSSRSRSRRRQNVRQQPSQESDEEYFRKVNSPEYREENVRQLNELMLQDNTRQQPSQESDEAYFARKYSSENIQKNVDTLNDELMRNSQ